MNQVLTGDTWVRKQSTLGRSGWQHVWRLVNVIAFRFREITGLEVFEFCALSSSSDTDVPAGMSRDDATSAAQAARTADERGRLKSIATDRFTYLMVLPRCARWNKALPACLTRRCSYSRRRSSQGSRDHAREIIRRPHCAGRLFHCRRPDHPCRKELRRHLSFGIQV